MHLAMSTRRTKSTTTVLYSCLLAQIRLTVPGDTSQCSDARFAGSFVLYNYARLANLVKNFEKACKLGGFEILRRRSLARPFLNSLQNKYTSVIDC